MVTDGNTYTASKTSSQLAVGSSFTLGGGGSSTISSVDITRTGNNSFEAFIWIGGTGTASLQVSYTVTRSTSKINFTGDNNILWSSTGWYMTNTQTANLSENVSEQLSGIVLVWSAYVNGSAQNYDWFYQFVPKDHVTARSGQGITTGVICNASGSHVGMKYVYVSDSKITGYASNSTSQSGSGINFNNAYWVLRYVLGV